jgi:dihydrodipicolinate synthase/N-acetylneuraminate lyase
MPPTHPSAILATAVVPWTPDYALDEARFRRQVAVIAENLTRHIYVFGTAGEGYAVTDAQFDAVARAFWGAAQEHGVAPMLGVISLSLPTIVERIERGRALGFREFQLSLPSWGALNDPEVDRFFAETCGRFPDCRFHHYNLLRTKRLLTAVDYRRLAAAHPNLVAVKCSTDDPAILDDLLTVSPRLRFYFTEFGYALARRQGRDVGLLISIATAHYARAQEFVAGDDAARGQAVAELRAMVGSLKEISAGRSHIDGAFDKMLYRLTDPTFPLRLLPPYATATDADFDRFRAALPARWKTAME